MNSLFAVNAGGNYLGEMAHSEIEGPTKIGTSPMCGFSAATSK
jgi:hypothetical protein